MNVVASAYRHQVLADTVPRELRPLAFLVDAKRSGVFGGLITIVGVDGGSPKPVGTHLAVLSDGRHMGYVSGGCVEPAIATEIAPLLAEPKDQIIRFGKGSCYMDIRFPCGGGADLLVHMNPAPQMLQDALDRVARREPFAIAFNPRESTSTMVAPGGPTGWRDDVFVRRYLPRTRLVLAGRGPDFEVMARVAASAEFELSLVTPDEGSASALGDLDATIELLGSATESPRTSFDPWTATVTLFHEHEWEHTVLARAAAGPGFYVGAMGSQRTHQARRERLATLGLTPYDVERVRGPIGLVARTKEPGSLALSVLAEIAAARAELERS